jgi:hypothetical protein
MIGIGVGVHAGSAAIQLARPAGGQALAAAATAPRRADVAAVPAVERIAGGIDTAVPALGGSPGALEQAGAPPANRSRGAGGAAVAAVIRIGQGVHAAAGAVDPPVGTIPFPAGAAMAGLSIGASVSAAAAVGATALQVGTEAPAAGLPGSAGPVAVAAVGRVGSDIEAAATAEG